MRRLLKILLVAIIIIFITTYTNISIASNKSELQNEKENLSNSISEAKNELESIKEEKSETLKEVENLMNKISEYQGEIEELTSKISDIEDQIKDAKKKIEEDEEEYKRQQEALNERLIAMYENGDTSYLDVMLSASTLTDFISGYYMVSELATFDTDMLEQVEQEKKKIEQEKAEFEKSKESLSSVKKEKKSKVAALNVAKQAKEEKVINLSQEEQETQKEIEEMLEDKIYIEKQLKKIAQEELEAARVAQEVASRNNSNNSITQNMIYSGSPSSSGYIFPVVGCSKSSIRNKSFPSYSGHTGVDINIGVSGKSVVAVKDGTVVTSTALKNSNGNYRSYGEYIIIRHNDGTMTLYAHMLAGSRTVSTGQTVKQGQVIGTVGSTGNSTGTHLHFEVRVFSSASGTYSYKVVNPIPYLP